MSYYQINRDKLLEKAKLDIITSGGGKEKPLSFMKIIKTP